MGGSKSSSKQSSLTQGADGSASASDLALNTQNVDGDVDVTITNQGIEGETVASFIDTVFDGIGQLGTALIETNQATTERLANVTESTTGTSTEQGRLIQSTVSSLALPLLILGGLYLVMRKR